MRRSEFRHRQVRGVLLQRLINDERATAGLHGLELIGRDQLINAAAAFADDCRGLVDWDQYRLKLTHGEMLLFSLGIMGRAARGIAPAPSEVSCRVCASGRRWLGYFCDLRQQNLPRKRRIAWVLGTTSRAFRDRERAILLDLPDSIYVHAAAYIP